MPKKEEYVKFKNYEWKIKSPFITYAGFESILLSKENTMPSKTHKSLIRAYFKNILLAVIDIN